MSWLSDLARPHNLVLFGVILSMSGLFVSAIGVFRLTRSGPASPDQLAAKYTELDTRLQEVARLRAEVAATNSELSGLRQQYETWLNGGDSFCYASAAIIARKAAIRSIVHHGKYPLYDIELTIKDTSAGTPSPPEHVHLDYLAPNSSRLSGRWNLPPDRDEQNYVLHISTRNGSLTEEIQFRRTGDRWTASLRVFRDSTGQLLLTKTRLRQSEPLPGTHSAQRMQGGERLGVPAKAIEALAASGWNEVERVLPPFELEDTDGRKWSLADFAGKSVLVNIWATWCASCIAEHTHVQRLYADHRDDAAVAVVSFNIDSDPAPAVDYLNTHEYTFPVLFARDLISQIFEVISVPRTWIVDSKGVVRWERIGFDPREPWETEAERLLEKTRPGTPPRF